MEILLFNENSEPTKVDGIIHANGLEMKNGVFIPLENMNDYVFGDVALVNIHTEKDGALFLTPLNREEAYATTYTQQEAVSESIEYFSNTIDSICDKVDNAVYKLKKAQNNPQELVKLIGEFKDLVQIEVLDKKVTLSVKNLSEKALKLQVALGHKGKIKVTGAIDNMSEKVLISNSLIEKYPELAKTEGGMLKIEGITSTPMYIKTYDFPIKIGKNTVMVNAGMVPDLESKVGFPLLLSVDIFHLLVKDGAIKLNLPST